MIPKNLLKTALSLIGNDEVLYLEFEGEANSDDGIVTSSYKDGISLKGSFQAVPRSRYEMNGLDLQKNYINFYTSQDINDLVRNKGQDLIIFASKTYQTLSETDWVATNGWTGVLCVEVSLNAG